MAPWQTSAHQFPARGRPKRLYINMQLPKSASLERTTAAAKHVEDVLAKTPGIQYHKRCGFQFAQLCADQLQRLLFCQPETVRPPQPGEQYQAIKARLNQNSSQLPEGTVFSFSPPAIPGVGTSGGVTFVLEDRAGKDVKFLSDNLNQFMAAARKRPELAQVSTTFIPSVPQQFINVDRDKVLKQGVALTDVYNTIQAYMGGLFVNYYNDFGRTWQVYVEAEAPYRSTTNDLGQFYVRNGQGHTVPLTALARFENRSGPEFTMRYNEYRSAQINASALRPAIAPIRHRRPWKMIFRSAPRRNGLRLRRNVLQEQKARQGWPPSVIFGFSLLFFPDSRGSPMAGPYAHGDAAQRRQSQYSALWLRRVP